MFYNNWIDMRKTILSHALHPKSFKLETIILIFIHFFQRQKQEIQRFFPNCLFFTAYCIVCNINTYEGTQFLCYDLDNFPLYHSIEFTS